MEDIENRRKKEVEGSDEVKENNQNESEEDLKNIIARHPLFEVLIESHMKCLEVINSFFLIFYFAIFVY